MHARNKKRPVKETKMPIEKAQKTRFSHGIYRNFKAVKEDLSEATDIEDRSERTMARKDHSQEKEEASEETVREDRHQALVSETQRRRASTRRISTISVTKTRAESTR